MAVLHICTLGVGDCEFVGLLVTSPCEANVPSHSIDMLICLHNLDVAINEIYVADNERQVAEVSWSRNWITVRLQDGVRAKQCKQPLIIIDVDLLNEDGHSLFPVRMHLDQVFQSLTLFVAEW